MSRQGTTGLGSLLLLGVAIIVAIVAGREGLRLLTEAWWFDAVGELAVFRTRLAWQSGAGAVVFAVFFLVLWVNYRIALGVGAAAGPTLRNRLERWMSDTDLPPELEQLLRSVGPGGGSDAGGNGEAPDPAQGASIRRMRDAAERVLRWTVLGGIAVISLFAAVATAQGWLVVARYHHALPFDAVDPIFSRDIGFYMFELPLLQAVQNGAGVLVFFSLLAAAGVYAARGVLVGADSQGWRGLARSGPWRHLLVLVGLGALVMAVGYWFDRYELLYSSDGVVFGAGYTDAHARLTALAVMTAVAAGLGLLAVATAALGDLLPMALGLGAFLAAAVLVNGIYPNLQQRFEVEPNELERERPYIRHSIEQTRRAYGLSTVERRSFPSSGSMGRLTVADLEENEATLKNVRLWDWRPLLSTYRQIQELRLYYSFRDVDIDRYQLADGEIRQLMLSARELVYGQVPQRAKTWVNQRLKYTHGYGLVMSPVNVVTPEGLPELFVRDLPPVAVDSALEVTRPAIYYGEETNTYIFTRTTTEEFDYPLGDQNAFTTYTGGGGVPMGSLLRRFAYALEFGSLKLLISDYMTEETHIHYRRRIRDRIQTVAPFLRLDSDPYMVVLNGRLKWIVDAYTVSDRFPYAEPVVLQGDRRRRVRLNYMRNAVKVVVDAYDGDMRFYVADAEDPVLGVHRRLFPELFAEFEEAPADLRAHFRYPIDLFRIQAHMYRAYHMTDPDVFYNREDMWRFPTEIYQGNEQRLDPYYVIMRLPENDAEEFLLILPFTPTSKNNMVAWMAARSDAPNYGDLMLYEFPKKELVYGPMQIEARIDQNPLISEQLTLWDQQGSNVIRGNLLVIPIADSLLYVEPIFLRSEQGEMPELKRVIVSHDGDVVMAKTLEGALRGVFGEGAGEAAGGLPERELTQGALPAPAPGGPSALGIDGLIEEAEQTFQRGQRALREGEWSAYGEAQEELRDVLRRLGEAATSPTVQPVP